MTRSGRRLKSYTKIILMSIMKYWQSIILASENYEKAAGYSKLSAKKAEKAASLNDAITYAKKRVACY